MKDMELISDPAVMARMQLAFDLSEFAAKMMHQNLRRWYPNESEAEIERRFVAWLQKRPWDGPVPPPAPERRDPSS